MDFPKLKFEPRDREYKSYKEILRDKVVYEYLFNSKSRRWLDENILGLDPEYSRGWQSFGILNHLGLTNAHKGVYKGKTVSEAVYLLKQLGKQDYDSLINVLERLINVKPNEDNINLFTPPTNAPKLHKKVGSSQYTDGVRIDEEFQNIFNLPSSTYYVERGKARPIRILFNNKVFVAEYRFENQTDKSRVLQSIRFKKDLKEEFKKVFPDPVGEFIIQQGADLNHFVFTHMAAIIEDEDEESEYPEGKVAYKTHRVIERDSKVIKQAKEKFAKKHGGRLFCEACGFDFVEKYGERGSDFIEGHHTKLVSEMKEGEKTKVTDISMLCSNCHKMIHRKPVISVHQLALLIKQNTNCQLPNS